MSVDKYRKQIDEIDEKIIGLLNDRIKAALEIGSVKDKTDCEVYVPSREKQVLERVAELNSGPLKEESIQAHLSRNHVCVYFNGTQYVYSLPWPSSDFYAPSIKGSLRRERGLYAL